MRKSLRNLVVGASQIDKAFFPPREVYLNAACTEETSELFFSTEKSEIAEARQICMSCPVRQKCLAQALLVDNDGMMGGLTRQERLKKAKGQILYTLDDINEAIRIRRDLEFMQQSEFASKYGIHPKTAGRWKAIISKKGDAA